jgi:chromosome partitioning protein
MAKKRNRTERGPQPGPDQADSLSSTARDGTSASGVPGKHAARVIAIANQKGGVGKSTTAVNLGACLAEAGKVVLVIDLDPQGNASTGVGISHSGRDVTIYEVLTAGMDISAAVLPTDMEGLAVVPSTIDLAGAEIELVSQFSREARLSRALESVRASYDFILLDCPPSLGLLTVNALTAADELIVPIQCEYYALEGLGQLLKNVRLVQQNVNPRLRLTGIVMTMFDSRTKLADQVVAEVRAYFGPRVYDSVIPRSVRLAEAPGFGKTIIQYDPASKGARAYRHLAEELLTKAAGDGLGEIDLTSMGQGMDVEPSFEEEPDDARDTAAALPVAPAWPLEDEVGPAPAAIPREPSGQSTQQDAPPSAPVAKHDPGELERRDTGPPAEDLESGPALAADASPDGTRADNDAGVRDDADLETARLEQETRAPDPGEPLPTTQGNVDQRRPRDSTEGSDEPSRSASTTGDLAAGGGGIEPESPAPQPLSGGRLLQIVAEEWDGMGVGPDEEVSGAQISDEPTSEERTTQVQPRRVEPIVLGELPDSVEEPEVPAEQPEGGKRKRWLFGKSKGGHT